MELLVLATAILVGLLIFLEGKNVYIHVVKSLFRHTFAMNSYREIFKKEKFYTRHYSRNLSHEFFPPTSRLIFQSSLMLNVLQSLESAIQICKSGKYLVIHITWANHNSYPGNSLNVGQGCKIKECHNLY